MTHFQIQALLHNGVSSQQIQAACELEEMVKIHQRVERQMRSAHEHMEDFQYRVDEIRSQLLPVARAR